MLTQVRRWTMAERCAWPRYCNQDRTDASGEFCYYHFKLVEGQIDAAAHSKAGPDREKLIRDIAEAGAVPGAIVSSRAVDAPKNRRIGFVKSGILHLRTDQDA